MNCERFMSLLPLYPDAMPDAETTEAFLAHAAACEACAARLAEHTAMLDSLTTLDDAIAPPDALADRWQRAIAAEPAPRARRPARWQGWALTAAAVVICVFGGTSLMRNGLLFASPDMAKQDTAESAFIMEEEALPAAAQGAKPVAKVALMADAMEAEDAEAPAPAAMLAHSATIALSSRQYDEDLEAILALLAQAGGWVDYETARDASPSADAQGIRAVTLRMRLPQDGLHAFTEALGAIGQQTAAETVIEDISAAYNEATRQQETQAAQVDRLKALHAQAEEPDDILRIGEQLAEAEKEIDALTTSLAEMAQRAAMATVTLSLEEIVPMATPTPLGLSERLARTFRATMSGARSYLEDMLLFLVLASPYIIGAIVLIFVGVGLYRVIRNHRKKQTDKKEKKR